MTEMEQETATYIEMQAALLFSQVCYIPMETHVSYAKSHYSSPTHIKTTHYRHRYKQQIKHLWK